MAELTRQGVRNLDTIGPKPRPRFKQDRCEHRFEFSHCHESSAVYRCACGKEDSRPIFAREQYEWWMDL